MNKNPCNLYILPCNFMVSGVNYMYCSRPCMLDFAAKVVGSAACSKIEEVPTMHATAMRISTMPSDGIGSLSPLFRSPQKQASKQASKPLFSNKGLLLSDRSLSGHHFHTNSAIMTRENCCHDGRSFTPRNPVFEDFRGFFIFSENGLQMAFHCYIPVIPGFWP